MKTTSDLMRAVLLIPLLVVLVTCGEETAPSELQTDRVSQRLDDRPGEVEASFTPYAAELSADGTQYCAKEQPKLCAPAQARQRAGRFACRADNGSSCNDSRWDRGCICCYWVPGSWPFEIRCGVWPLFP